MNFNRYSIIIGVRTALIMLTLLGLTFLLFNPGYHVATLVLFLVLVLQCWNIIQFTARTNQELVRFLDAAKHADYSQRFELSGLQNGFTELGKAFADILQKFQSIQQRKEQDYRHLKAIVEQVPVPLISIKHTGELTFWNNASRRLFASSNIVRVKDLDGFGLDFSQQLTNMKAGDKRLINFFADDLSIQLSVSASDVIVDNQRTQLFSLQDIQSELDDTQMQAWQDLVNVLTHEIMNSITPVASLAKTAVDLVNDTKQHNNLDTQVHDSLSDIHDAVNTVARRSDGLMQFVGSYRKLTNPTQPNKTPLNINDVFQQVIAIVKQDQYAGQATFNILVTPEQMVIHADRAMLEQVLINLLKNALQASHLVANPMIELCARINRRGVAVIDISDNGIGIAPEIRDKIFIPFFTSKKEGSGVGLALTRQVMNAHNGTINVSTSKSGGAHFSLVF